MKWNDFYFRVLGSKYSKDLVGESLPNGRHAREIKNNHFEAIEPGQEPLGL